MNVNKIALCSWLIWSDSNATHLLLFISTICAITHHSSLMCFYSLFVPAVQGCTCIGSASFFSNQMFKSKCKKNANASILTYVCRLNVQIQMQKRYASIRTCVCGSNVQIQMQKKDMHLICVCRSNVQMQPIKEFTYCTEHSIKRSSVSQTW